MSGFLKIKSTAMSDLILTDDLSKILDEKMNTEDMLKHKPAFSTQVDIEKWSDVVLTVKLIDGCPFVCDEEGLPIIGQKDISIQSVAGKPTVFTATFRQLK